MSVEDLLPVLADGQYHSGEELGEILKVSRTAVWKQIKKIEDLLGQDVESVKGKGYRLVGGLELLEADQVTSYIDANVQGELQPLMILPVIESTNRELMKQVASGVTKGIVCTAEKQTAGRGRRGRQWHSPYGRNLYFSLAWQFDGGAAVLEGLSLAVGVCVVTVLEDMGVQGVQLKWPNDLLWQGKKVAGILLEMTGDASGVCQVVVGVGINVAMEEAKCIDQPWTDLETVAGFQIGRNELLGRLINKLVPMMAAYQQDGFVRYKSRWCELDAFADSEVKVLLGRSEQSGIARGCDDSGALQLELEDGALKAFNGGEISVRKLL